MAKWKLCASTIFEISHFQAVQCACQNPISPKVFNGFSKSLPQQEDFEGGHLGEKFEARRYFTFAMAKWKFCASTTFEILPLSTSTLCQQKSYISKGIQPIFEIFASARRLWGWAFEWKASGAQVFNFCHGKVKTLRMYNIWNFPISSCTLCLQKSYISKGIQPIFEIFVTARRFWGVAFGWNVSGAQVFYFCYGKVKTLRMYNIWNFSLSTCTLSRQKSYISKGIEPIFEMFASTRRCWRWAFGWKVSGAPLFYFCKGKVKTSRIENIWNFVTFNLYTVLAKMLILQTYSTYFRNLCLSSKMLRVGTWVESFRGAGILLLQWQGENFAHRQHLKIRHF